MLGVGTLFRYLTGDAEAIRTIAIHRRALFLGFLFVLLAGVAREWDAEDLLHEPWHLLIPVGASLATSFVLYGLLRLLAWRPGSGNPWTGYLSFLALYWWTGPLAWLYAIPVERVLGPLGAAQANLLLLGGVSLARVLIITRAISVIGGVRFFRALFPVLFFGDVVALIGLLSLPDPLLAFMGGIQLTESESFVLDVSYKVRVWGFVTLPVWLGGTVLARRVFTASRFASPDPRSPSEGPSVRLGLVALLVVAAVVSAALLRWGQPEQQRRHAFEEDLGRGRLTQAVARVQGHPPSAFPPQWDPPPHVFRERSALLPTIEDVLATALEMDAPVWFVSLYALKGRRHGAHLARDPRIDERLQGYAHRDELAPDVLDALHSGS